jgi:hypothetical protein
MCDLRYGGARILKHRSITVTNQTSSCAAIRVVRRILFAALFLTACVGGESLQRVDYSTLPQRSASPEELVAQVNNDGAAIAGLKGKLELGLQKGPGEDFKRCRGMLLSRREPEQGLYLKGYKRLIPTFFTLVSDGVEFWFHIPRDDVVYTGPADFSWTRHDSLDVYLNAGDLFRALYVRPVHAGSAIDVQDEDTAYVVSIYAGAVIDRRLWIERKRFNVVRELYYDSNGIEQLEIRRKEYVDVDGRLYPASLVLRDAVSGSSVFLDFNSITFDPENVPDNAFRFDIPEGVDVKRLEPTQPQT